MPQKGKRSADDKLLLALACGASAEAAAQQAGVSVHTVYRRLEDAQFRARLRKLRADIVQRTAGALTAASTESVRTLLELQWNTNPPAVRLEHLHPDPCARRGFVRHSEEPQSPGGPPWLSPSTSGSGCWPTARPA